MSIRSFFGFGKGRKSQSQSSKRTLRMEALEERALLSAVPLSTSEYANLRAEYAEFNLPANMNDLNVITLDLAQGDGLSQLKSAITTAGTTTKSDLIVVRTSDTANTLIYTAAGNELLIDIDASQYGSITIIGWGEEKFTLDANQKSRVMSVTGSITGSSTVVNLGGLTITNGNVENMDGHFGNAELGGGIKNSGILTITNCEISGNTASGSYSTGGGIYNFRTLTVINSTISGNTASSDGGGICNNSGILTITNSTISGNTASSDGGGIYNTLAGTLTVTNSTISGNTADFYGGGICNSAGVTLMVTNSEISGNTADFGGGIYNCGGIDNDGSLTVTNSTIVGNIADYGGGIDNDGSLTVTNSTIAGNSADNGGGIENNGILTVTNSTIAGNTADCGGGISNAYGILTITNSIVSRNYNDNILNFNGNTWNYNGNILGHLSSNSSNNVIGYEPGFVSPPQFNSIGRLINADTMDLHLRSDSIAIDKGDNTVVVDIESDLDGNARIFGVSVDIGAYEYQGDRDDKPMPYFSVVNTLNDSFDLNDNEWSLREAIYYATEYVTITFADKLEGTIVLTQGNLQIEALLAIDGDNRITLDGNQQTCIFNVSAGTEESPVVLNGLTIQNGNAEWGGGINNSGTLTITNSEISGNTTSNHGGGIYNFGTLTVTNSTIAGNSARYAGGIYNHYGTLTVTNSTIAGNTADCGGGIYNDSYDDFSSTANIYNTIVACNTASASSDKDIYCDQSGFVYGYNCLSSYTEWDNGNNNIVYNSNKPLFIDATNGDYHLAIGSQAIDKGNNAYAVDANGAALVYDLDNRSRIVYGVVDIGAYEYHAPLATPTLSVEATGSDSISVTVGSVANASGYRVEYSTSADFANAVSQNVNAGKTTISGLTAETTYYFRAMALGTGDYSNSNYSESAAATTLPAPVLEAEVNARIVFQDSLKDADTAAELPEGITSIRAGKTVYAEIWVKDVESTDPAIIGGYVNMLYDSDALSVLDVTYGTEICYLTGFQTYENGEIATIGGTTVPSVLDKGDDEWVRLATVSFVADMEGFTTVSLGVPNDYHDNLTRTDGRILSNAQIDYGSSVLEITAACPMDIDGDGYIGVSDYSLLSKAWRSSPGKENWDPACDIDGDGYVGVSDYTFLSKNWRKYADDPDLVYPEPNASPATAVSEDNFIEMNNTVALEADETANVCLTAVSTKTASDTTDEVPVSLTEINPGDSFFVEIRVRNFNGYEGTTLCGLTGGYLNMSYPEELLNLGDVTYGRAFSQLNNLQDDSQAGFIDLIGGVAGTGVLDKGDDEWVRLATVSFTASENGDALIESLPPTDWHDNLTLTSGKTLKNDEISFGVINLKIGSTVIQLKVNNDFVKTTLNNSVVIDYRENDAVADWSKTTVEFGDASNGEYSVNGNGTITYTPEDGFYGTDAVSYVVVDSTGELSTGAIVISVGLPIATSVQKTSGNHSPSSAMAASVERLTDWDNCCVELWAQDVNALNPGETTFTLSYNPTIYNAPYFSACADGVALSVTDSAALPDGSVEVQLTARVLESLSSQTDNLFLGTVVLTPSMDDGAGVVAPLASEPVCALDGSETPTTVEAMPYDLIRNGSVDVNDFVAFATVFGYVPGNMSPVNPLYVQTAKSDFNKDGSVNADDFVLFAINFGATKNTADKPAPLASAASELRVASNELREGVLKSECKTALPLVEQLPSSNYSQLKAEAYSAALLDLYDNQDVADLSGSSDVLAKSRLDSQLFDVESDSSHKASSQAIDAVLEEDLLAIDWN